VKIFTDKGREEYSKYDITYGKGTKIKDVEARVTKPDGTVVFLNKDDVFEREIVKATGVKIKAKTFALPGLETGSVVEYRYREIEENASANMPLIFQRDIPIETVSYFVKPFAGELGMRYEKFNVGETKFEKDKGGFYRATMTNVPALHEEPYMLPVNEVRSWMYIYYARDSSSNSQEYWKNISRAVYEGSNASLKVNDDVRNAANEAVKGAATEEEKLKKTYDYTKSQIKNISYAANVSDDDKKAVKNSKTPADTLRLKMGSGGDIDSLFGAMARAAGFDARVALSGNRSELFFNPNIANFSLMLNSSSIAVKLGNDWRFFSPAEHYVPFGMMNWSEEAQMAIVTDPKELIWKMVPLSPPEKTMIKRTGKFKLLEDGTLEGDARVEYTGHYAIREKLNNFGDSGAQQEKTLRSLIKENILGTAEIQNFTIENATDPEKPFAYTFKVRVPNYASKTGKRLFFQPNIFERSSHPRFTSNARKYEIYFNYPFSENDDISIDFPAGFSLENADAPASIQDSKGIYSHVSYMGITKDKKTLVYRRTFSFGGGGNIDFQVVSYPAIKGLFEAFNKADVHQMTLHQDAVTAAVLPSN
ncbi:MAG: DUF3857 domain-containing protein, partial [Acidobacteriota bacterium]